MGFIIGIRVDFMCVYMPLYMGYLLWCISVGRSWLAGSVLWILNGLTIFLFAPFLFFTLLSLLFLRSSIWLLFVYQFPPLDFIFVSLRSAVDNPLRGIMVLFYGRYIYYFFSLGQAGKYGY